MTTITQTTLRQRIGDMINSTAFGVTVGIGAILALVGGVITLAIIGFGLLSFIIAPAVGTVTDRFVTAGHYETSCFYQDLSTPICSDEWQDTSYTLVLRDAEGHQGPVTVSKAVYESSKVGQTYAQ